MSGIEKGVRALLRRHTVATAVPTPPATVAAGQEPEDAERLAARTAEVITAALLLVNAADSGDIARTVAMAYAVSSEVQIMAGDLREAVHAGRAVDPELAAAALRRRLDTAVNMADLVIGAGL